MLKMGLVKILGLRLRSGQKKKPNTKSKKQKSRRWKKPKRGENSLRESRRTRFWTLVADSGYKDRTIWEGTKRSTSMTTNPKFPDRTLWWVRSNNKLTTQGVSQMRSKECILVWTRKWWNSTHRRISLITWRVWPPPSNSSRGRWIMKVGWRLLLGVRHHKEC